MGQNKSTTTSIKQRGKPNQLYVLWKIRGQVPQDAASWLFFDLGQLGTKEEMRTNIVLAGESARNYPALLGSLSLLPGPTTHLALINPTPTLFLWIKHRHLGTSEKPCTAVVLCRFVVTELPFTCCNYSQRQMGATRRLNFKIQTLAFSHSMEAFPRSMERSTVGINYASSSTKVINPICNLKISKAAHI